MLDMFDKAAAYTNNDAAETPEPKKKVGRPKTAPPTKRKPIAVPVTLLEKYEAVKDGTLSSSFNEYIVRLIESDLNTNYDNYMKIQEMKNGFLNGSMTLTD